MVIQRVELAELAFYLNLLGAFAKELPSKQSRMRLSEDWKYTRDVRRWQAITGEGSSVCSLAPQQSGGVRTDVGIEDIKVMLIGILQAAGDSRLYPDRVVSVLCNGLRVSGADL